MSTDPVIGRGRGNGGRKEIQPVKSCLCRLDVGANDLQVSRVPIMSTYFFSLRFNSHLPGGPRLAGARMSPFCILLELRVMETTRDRAIVTIERQ